MDFKLIKTLVLLAICMLCISGCKSTPENQPITQKNNANSINDATLNIANSDYPANFCSAYSKANVKIIYDAAIEIPKVHKIPIYKYNNQILNQTALSTIVESFYGSSKIYQPEQVSKEEYEQRYIELQDRIAKAKADPESVLESAEDIEQELHELETLIQNAPEEDSLQPVDIEMNNNHGFYSFQSRGFVNNVEYDLRVMNSIDYFRLLFERGVDNRYVPINKYYPAVNTSSDMVEGISKSDAQKTAEAYLAKLPAANMVLSGYAVGLHISETGSYTDPSNLVNPLAHIFIFTKKIDGIPITYDSLDSANKNEYSPSMYYDRIEIAISSRGVEDIKWQGLIELSDVVKDDANILPFETVIEQANSNMYYKFASDTADDQFYMVETNLNHERESVQINITKVILGYMQQLVPNESGQYELIPVCDFYGTITSYYKDDDPITQYRYESSIATINAMNGSIVDRDMGY